MLANDTAPEGEALRVVGLTQAKNGQAMIFEDGAKAGYQPAPGFCPQRPSSHSLSAMRGYSRFGCSM